MTTQDIYQAILSKPNCSCNSAVGFIQNLHQYAKNTVNIINTIENPRESERANILKSDLLGLLEGYDRLKRGAPNAKLR